MALFTATPQLEDIELRRAARKVVKNQRQERWQTGWRVNALYHEAMAAAAQGHVAMIDNERMERAVKGGVHCFAALLMIDMIDRYFAIPFEGGKGEKVEAGRLLRRWQHAVSGCSPAVQRWREREPQWLAMIGGAK